MSARPLKVVLVGPLPPPHGGISVHVDGARRALGSLGVPCEVADPAVPGGLLRLPRLLGKLARLQTLAHDGWLLHVHANGHNARSWLAALLAATASRAAPGRVLTLHSGMAASYLAGSARRRALARAALRFFDDVVCVNGEIARAVVALGMDARRVAIVPARLPEPPLAVGLPEGVERWLARHDPVIGAVLSFRPEYGFGVLLQSLEMLAPAHPGLGCLVIGDGEREQDARESIRLRRMEEAVLLAGDVPHDACLAMIARSDLLVRPTLADGDAVSVREALALRRPVVATDVGHRPPGVVLVPPGDAGALARAVEAVVAGDLARGEPPEWREPEPMRQLLDVYARARSRRRRGRLSPAPGPVRRETHRPGAPGPPGASPGPAALARRATFTLSRLREMDGIEIRHRLGERLRQTTERVRWRLPASRGPEARLLARLPVVAGRRDPVRSFLSGAASERFYASVGDGVRPELAALVARRWPHWRSRIAEDAHRLRRHRIGVLGHGEIALGDAIDWHRDPVCGHRWDRRFFADYDLVREGRDPKPVLELGRHQHLPRLAKAWYLLGDERDAREVVDQMLGWIEQNPPSTGIHWHASLEIALRCLSWLWAISLVLPSEALDEGASRRIAASLVAQLDHVAAYPSLHTSPNTHLLGEATALVVAGLCLRGLEGADEWLEAGSRILSTELSRQVGGDGLHDELAPAYHCYALDGYLQVLALAGRCHHELPGGMRSGVERMLGALLALVRPDGTLPRLGDDDGGRLLALADVDYGSAVPLLCEGALLFGRPDLAGPAGELREEAIWLLGIAGLRAWDGMERSFPTDRRASLPDAGYVVHRSGWGASDAQLVFDAGGLGARSGGHGHADALAVTLHARGRELLVDPGTYVYGGSPWRDVFRGTAAHNTVTVDGRSQSEPAGTFRWGRRASARLLADESHGEIEYAAAEHDGYAGIGVVHRRHLLYVHPDYWLVVDELLGTGEHVMEVAFHLAPDATVVSDDARRPRERHLRTSVGPAALGLSILASVPLELSITRDAPAAWVSRRYGEKVPAPVAIARTKALLPVTVATLLVPHLAGGEALRATAVPVRAADGDAPSSLALRIDGGPGRVDVAALAPDGSVVVVGPGDGLTPWRAAGGLTWRRVSDGRIVRTLALDRRSTSGATAGPRSCPRPGEGTREEASGVRHRGSR